MRTPLQLRIVRAAFAALVATATGSSFAPVAAQGVPWVGLSMHRAHLLAETGAGHDGPGPADHFGFALTAGDFNGDGVDDIATGVPYNDCDFVVWDCGSVVVRHGIRGVGLSSETRVLRQPGSNLPDGAEEFEKYGYALAAGDFDGSGHDELIIGVPDNRFQGAEERIPTGSVDMLYGTPGGLTDWSIEYRPGQFGLPGHPSYQSSFGAAIAVGDFDGDGRDDVAVGAPNDTVACEEFNCRGGSVMVFGRDAEGNVGGYEMFLGDQGLPDIAEEGERFGHSLAAGDFNGDGYDDLAIGVPLEDDTGAVLVVKGSPWSLLFAEHWYIGQWDMSEPAEPGDRFGDALAAGDFNGDGYDDLAMSSSNEDGANGSPNNAGLGIVSYGSPSGLMNTNTRLWQDDLFGPGESEDFDYFGSSFAAGDFNGDGIDDLAIGHEGENGSSNDSGAVSIVLGTPQGLFGARRQANPGPGTFNMIPDTEAGAPYYGFALASGDFDGNGQDDLAVGAPNRDTANQADAGGAAVLYGHLLADGFESGTTQLWSRRVP